MSFVASEYGGPKVQPREKRRRLTDAEVRQMRSSQMYVQRLNGWGTVKIALYFGFSRQFVNREIASIPPTRRALIERKFRRGEISVA